MDWHNIPTDKLVFYLVLYGCLPLWVLMGLADYVCHRLSGIERTSGMRESIFHATMGVQVGIPMFLGLYLEINVLLLLIMFVVLIFHEWVAHMDVKYAQNVRKISIAEIHVHSFLEVLPFVIVALIICMNWSAFIDLITLNWAGHMGLGPKKEPLDSGYVNAWFHFMMVAGVAPYVEELWRCWRYQQTTKNVPMVTAKGDS